MAVKSEAVIKINDSKPIGYVSDLLFSSFIEQMGRAVYGGVYEPENINSDEFGFRKDVSDLIKELNISYVRYPGGNFVSGYDWKNGIGDVKKRPLIPDLAWQEMEPNYVGVDEFCSWAERMGIELIMAVNLGTGTPQSAFELLQYCNGTFGYWADLRKANGRERPYAIKYWCLGNEMDGEWQIGHKTAIEYAKIAKTTAQMMKIYDPSIKLIFCGSSSFEMPTFPEWEKIVLSECYNYVDYISSHRYYSYNKRNGNGKKEFIASYHDLDNGLTTLTSVIEEVKAEKKAEHPDKEPRDIKIALDEWNVWYMGEGTDLERLWETGVPREETIYSGLDAIVFASLINVIINHSNIVEISCVAQLVNVIAPILTKTNGGAIRQAIFYPLLYASNLIRGDVYKCDVNCKKIDGGKFGNVQSVTASFIKGEKNSYLWICNLGSEFVEVDLSKINEGKAKRHIFMQASDKRNSFEKPDAVKSSEIILKNSECIKLLPLSWNLIEFVNK